MRHSQKNTIHGEIVRLGISETSFEGGSLSYIQAKILRYDHFLMGSNDTRARKTDGNVRVFAVNGFPFAEVANDEYVSRRRKTQSLSRHLILEVGLHPLPREERDCIRTFSIFNRSKIVKKLEIATQTYLERN